MHNQPISAHCALSCVFCKSFIAGGAAVRRASDPFHVDCLVRILTQAQVAVDSRLGQPPAPERESKCEPFQSNTDQS